MNSEVNWFLNKKASKNQIQPETYLGILKGIVSPLNLLAIWTCCACLVISMSKNKSVWNPDQVIDSIILNFLYQTYHLVFINS